MLDSILTSAAASFSPLSFLLCLAVALALGALLALLILRQNGGSQSFAVTVALLPGVVCLIILLVSGNLGAGVAVAGTFSLVRFRSAPGSAREICAIFLAMAVGLACGMGYVLLAAIFTLIMGALSLLYARLGLGVGEARTRCKMLHITVPEDLEYGQVFDDLFATYTSRAVLTRVKTTNLGSLNRLSYEITLRRAGSEKQLIDALRCRNGNLEISCCLHGNEREL